MSYLGLLPISLVLLAALTFAIAYIIAVARGDVSPGFPYISDTGSKRPESSIFGQFLNLSSFLAFCTMYVRFKAVQAIASSLTPDRWLKRLNKSSIFFGCVSALGVSIVANFQEGTNVEAVHMVGALMAFLVGVIYCFLQTALSYHIYPEFNGLRICRWRLGISVVSFISLLVTITSGVIAIHQWDSSDHGSKSKFHWEKGDPGYSAHLVSTISEWVTALTFLFFFFTYVREFNKFNLKIDVHPLVRHLDEFPDQSQPDERTKLIT